VNGREMTVGLSGEDRKKRTGVVSRWQRQIFHGVEKGYLRSGFKVVRSQEEEDTENGERAYDDDDQQEEHPPGRMVPHHAAAHSGDHIRWTRL
jgi:hypothetical protein